MFSGNFSNFLLNHLCSCSWRLNSLYISFLSQIGSDFGDIFDVDYFIERMKGYARVVKELPDELKVREPFKVDCSKRKGQFDYVEEVLPSLLQHHYISFTPAMSQRRDRYLIFYPDHGLTFSIISFCYY